jgi:hypothetical protein
MVALHGPLRFQELPSSKPAVSANVAGRSASSSPHTPLKATRRAAGLFAFADDSADPLLPGPESSRQDGNLLDILCQPGGGESGGFCADLPVGRQGLARWGEAFR